MTSIQTDPGTAVPRERSAQGSMVRPASRNAALTLAGVMYILVTLFLAVGAINAQNNLLFWLFGFAIAILVTSGVLSGNAMMRLQARGLPISEIRAGEECAVQYQLNARSRFFPLFGLVVREEEPGLESLRPGVVVHLSPASSARATAFMIAHKRGRYRFPAFRVESTFPFGIIRKWVRYEQPRSVLVAPHVLPLQPTPPGIRVGRRLEEQFARAQKGAGSEFFGLRPYVPGDPRRKVAWKTSARRDGLVVIEHARESEPRVMIWLQKPGVSDPPELIERSIALACSLARLLLAQNCAVGFWAPWASIRLNPIPGSAQLKRIEYMLAVLELAEATPADNPPPARSGRLIRVLSNAEFAADPVSGEFAANQPDTWLCRGHQLPAALECEAGFDGAQ